MHPCQSNSMGFDHLQLCLHKTYRHIDWQSDLETQGTKGKRQVRARWRRRVRRKAEVCAECARNWTRTETKMKQNSNFPGPALIASLGPKPLGIRHVPTENLPNLHWPPGMCTLCTRSLCAVLPAGILTTLVLLKDAESMTKHESSLLGELKETCQRETHALIGELGQFLCCEFALYKVAYIIYDVICLYHI